MATMTAATASGSVSVGAGGAKVIHEPKTPYEQTEKAWNYVRECLEANPVNLPTFKVKGGKVRLEIRKKMNSEIANSITNIFGDFTNGIGPGKFIHAKDGINCMHCWKFATRFFLLVSQVEQSNGMTAFVPLLSTVPDLPPQFAALAKAIETAGYDYEVSVAPSGQIVYGTASNVRSRQDFDGTWSHETFYHISMTVPPLENAAEEWIRKTVAILFRNTQRIEDMVHELLSEVSTWEGSWDYFEEKLKGIAQVNFFGWIRAFQASISDKTDTAPSFIKVIRAIFNGMVITRDVYQSPTGHSAVLPQWDQLRNNFLSAVTSAVKATTVGKQGDRDYLTAKIVAILRGRFDPTKNHKHVVTKDVNGDRGVVNQKRAKRIEKMVEILGLNDIAGEHTTFENGLLHSWFGLRFTTTSTGPSATKSGGGGLLATLRADSGYAHLSRRQTVRQTGAMFSSGSSGGGGCCGAAPTELQPEMTLTEFKTVMTHLMNTGDVRSVEVKYGNLTAGTLGEVTSGPLHGQYFSSRGSNLSTCWPNAPSPLSYFGLSSCLNSCTGWMPVCGMMTNNLLNLHFVVPGSRPVKDYGIPTWRQQVRNEWYQDVDQSGVADYIVQSTKMYVPHGQLCCGVMTTRNPKTGTFNKVPRVRVTLWNGTRYEVNLTPGSNSEWKIPEHLTPLTDEEIKQIKSGDGDGAAANAC